MPWERADRRGRSTFTSRRHAEAMDAWRELWVVYGRPRLGVPGVKPDALALGMDVMFVHRRPPSVRRLYPSVRPDSSNLLKLPEDALIGFAWDDDGRFVDTRVREVYADPGHHPVTVLEAWVLPEILELAA